jgi:glycine/D-amino acid oxidase-like deaminating enzyme
VYHDELVRRGASPAVHRSRAPQGFFFEPRENGVVKVCNEFAGYTRVRRAQPFGAARPQKLSVPRSHATHPSDTMPAEGAASVRRVVTTLLPQFGARAFAEEKMCWCTDTADAQLLLCEDPRWKGLVLATGDSGHTFHALPAVGREVVDLLEGTVRALSRHVAVVLMAAAVVGGEDADVGMEARARRPRGQRAEGPAAQGPEGRAGVGARRPRGG